LGIWEEERVQFRVENQAVEGKDNQVAARVTCAREKRCSKGGWGDIRW